jgi:hypothetical protein
MTDFMVGQLTHLQKAFLVFKESFPEAFISS